MYIWLTLLIPCIVSIYMVFFHKEKFLWWELILPTAVCFVLILVSKLTIETVQSCDVEYNYDIVKKVTYYEPYTTWESRTCYRTVKCGKSTVSVPYDCSYCDENNSQYVAYTELGNSYPISKEHYNRIINKWGKVYFEELNRDINYHFNCGSDGDAYSSNFNNKPEHGEIATYSVSFVNKVKLAKDLFHFIDLDDDSAKKLGLYEYPIKYDEYKTECLIGFKDDNRIIEDRFQYLNYTLNKTKKSRFLILAFYNKPNMKIAELQRHYWLNSKDNEVIICIGLNSKTNEINWVFPFSWTKNKRTLIELREEISEMKILNYDELFKTVYSTINKYYIKKNFHEYDYVTAEISTGWIWFIIIITIITTGIVNYYCYFNEYEK